MKTCENCDGDGVVDEFNCSVGSASLCCGGCYKEVSCETCNGSGEVEYNEDMLTELESFMSDWNLTNEELIKVLEITR